MSEEYKCCICGSKFSTIFKLSMHILYKHKMSAKEYYDRYLFKDGDGICKKDGCNRQTKFVSISDGYKKYCCPSHARNKRNFINDEELFNKRLKYLKSAFRQKKLVEKTTMWPKKFNNKIICYSKYSDNFVGSSDPNI